MLLLVSVFSVKLSDTSGMDELRDDTFAQRELVSFFSDTWLLRATALFRRPLFQDLETISMGDH